MSVRNARAGLLSCGAALLVLAGLFAGCAREARHLDDTASTTPAAPAAQQSGWAARGTLSPAAFLRDYQDNAYALARGKHLFSWINCVGCHSLGGGGMGPPLMDDQWIYGSDPGAIYETISGGRPNGMPAFRGLLSETQLWQLVAYVRSLSGLAPTSAAPARSDVTHLKQPESTTPRQEPKGSSIPRASP